MQTECPQCHAKFRVTLAQLEAAKGCVRCGVCHTVFDAGPIPRLNEVESVTVEKLIVRPLEESDERSRKAARSKPGLRAADAPCGISGLVPDGASGPHETRVPSLAADAVDGDAGIPILLREDLEGLESGLEYRSHAPLFTLGSVVLGLLLGLQVAYFERHRLAKNPHLGPFVREVCPRLGCELDPPRDTAAIEVRGRTVYSHPQTENALVVTAVLVNGAAFPQPYPVVQLSFTDLQGRSAAARRFLPREYLPAGTAVDTLMIPGVPVSLDLAIKDPGTHVSAFEISFL